MHVCEILDGTRLFCLQTIPYHLLQQQLDIATVRELEDFLITECFYDSILKGKLDQQQACLQVRQASLISLSVLKRMNLSAHC